FDVIIKDQVTFPLHLWEVNIQTKEEKRLTGGSGFSVSSFTISDDGTKIGFIGKPAQRYASPLKREVYLLDMKSNTFTQITDNLVNESNLRFSPDSRLFAFVINDGEQDFMNLRKIYIMPSAGGKFTKLLNNFNYSASISFWSEDSRFIYFDAHAGVNHHLFRVSVNSDKIEQITNFDGLTSFNKHKISGKYIINHTNPVNPSNYYYSEIEDFADKENWTKLSDSNPQAEQYLLGKWETVQWKSTDVKTIEGILIKPDNFSENRKYPLIVQIHGGPAHASKKRFDASFATYTSVLVNNDYVVFQPNYRGSTGYGQKFTKEIAGDYFRQAFDDIMTGVDYLIDKNIAHPDSMGFMGWSAGGHWSNWTLVSTDRFKAISTGAGAVNWVSLYAQTDMQQTREFYFKGKPYDNWDHFIEVSPLKYINNAKTPTLIHFGEKDRRIPMPQGEELYMALKKLGVPTEFIVYPDMPHGLTKLKYQMVKMQSEFYWFEKWIRGKKEWFNWNKILQTEEK
ncbi:S9 family peptidase, partial [bacterium]|nr:S9 family peptidase [bacterium]